MIRSGRVVGDGTEGTRAGRAGRALRPVRLDAPAARSPIAKELPIPNTVSVALERTGPLGVAQSCVYPTRFPFVIGRGPDSDLRLCDPALSRRHCVLDLRDGRLVVGDLESRNGTEVNGQRVSEPRPLADGDLLWVGGSVFAVRLQAGATDAGHQPVLVEDDAAETPSQGTAL